MRMHYYSRHLAWQARQAHCALFRVLFDEGQSPERTGGAFARKTRAVLAVTRLRRRTGIT